MVRISYGEGNIAETEFSFVPKSELVETTSIFEVSLGSYSSFDVEYSIKGGIVKDMTVDFSSFSLLVQIESTDNGTISLDLTRTTIGAQKSYGSDDSFIVLIDGIEVAYQESESDFVSRLITINFEQGDTDIKILGTYLHS